MSSDKCFYFHVPVMRLMCVDLQTVSMLRFTFSGCLGRSNAILKLFIYARVYLSICIGVYRLVGGIW
jgi:hypothetical protein